MVFDDDKRAYYGGVVGETLLVFLKGRQVGLLKEEQQQQQARDTLL